MPVETAAGTRTEPSPRMRSPSLDSAWQYVFLGLSGRSGSTFLCHEISNQFPATLVLPEFRTIELLTTKARRTGDTIPVSALNRLVAQDGQHANDTQLHQLIQHSVTRPAEEAKSCVAALDALVAPMVGRTGYLPDVVLVQFGAVAAHADWLAAALGPRLRGVLAIVRDQRGAVSSQLHTARAYVPGEDMGRSDVAFCARRRAAQRRTLDRARRSDVDTRFEVVTYEDLVLDSEATLAGLVDLLGARGQAEESNVLQVAAPERGLHPHVDKTGLRDRADAWRRELGTAATVTVEEITRPLAWCFGYGIPPTSPRRRVIMWAQRARSVYLQLGYFARRAWQYRTQRRAAWDHLVARRMSRRA